MMLTDDGTLSDQIGCTSPPLHLSNYIENPL